MGFALGHTRFSENGTFQVLSQSVRQMLSDVYSDQQNLRISGCVLNSGRHLIALHYVSTQQITKRIPSYPAFTLVVSPQTSLPFRSRKKEELAAVAAEA
jgi:hypothetical protein